MCRLDRPRRRDPYDFRGSDDEIAATPSGDQTLEPSPELAQEPEPPTQELEAPTEETEPPTEEPEEPVEEPVEEPEESTQQASPELAQEPPEAFVNMQEDPPAQPDAPRPRTRAQRRLHVMLPAMAAEERAQFQRVFVEPDNADPEPAHPPRRGPEASILRAERAIGRRDSRDPSAEHMPAEMQASFARFVKKGPEMTQSAQLWISTNRPPIAGLAQVKQMLPRLPLTSNWTAKDRASVERRWLREPMRARMLDVVNKKELLTLYKSSLRLVHCLPRDIISCRFDLEYDGRQNRVLKAKGQSLMWSGPFCSSLAQLLVHPLWDSDISPLVLAIQYALVVDTNDSGPWGVPFANADGFLARLFQAKQDHPDTSVTKLRRRLNRQSSAATRDEYGRPTSNVTRSSWNIFFQALEALVKDKKPPTRRSGPFLVHVRHLDMVIEALDATRHMGFSRFLSGELNHRGIAGRRAVKDYPVQDKLRELVEYDILCERERLAFREKMEQGEQRTQSMPEPVESEDFIPIPDDDDADPILDDTAIPATQQSRKRPPRIDTPSSRPSKRTRPVAEETQILGTLPSFQPPPPSLGESAGAVTVFCPPRALGPQPRTPGSLFGQAPRLPRIEVPDWAYNISPDAYLSADGLHVLAPRPPLPNFLANRQNVSPPLPGPRVLGSVAAGPSRAPPASRISLPLLLPAAPVPGLQGPPPSPEVSRPQRYPEDLFRRKPGSYPPLGSFGDTSSVASTTASPSRLMAPSPVSVPSPAYGPAQPAPLAAAAPGPAWNSTPAIKPAPRRRAAVVTGEAPPELTAPGLEILARNEQAHAKRMASASETVRILRQERATARANEGLLGYTPPAYRMPASNRRAVWTHLLGNVATEPGLDAFELRMESKEWCFEHCYGPNGHTVQKTLKVAVSRDCTFWFEDGPDGQPFAKLVVGLRQNRVPTENLRVQMLDTWLNIRAWRDSGSKRAMYNGVTAIRDEAKSRGDHVVIRALAMLGNPQPAAATPAPRPARPERTVKL